MPLPQSTQTDFPQVIFSDTNGYALQKELSHKAGRRTFVAKELTTNTPVILKFLQFGSAVVGSTLSWEDIKLFKREAQILQHLSHPKIPQYKDSFETEIAGVQTFVLVQTYIPAPSLQSVVEAGELFTEEAVVAIAQQLLTTLVYLHSQLPPVIHRDLKPSNILISEPNPRSTDKSEDVFERQLYLVDFGAVQITATRNSSTVTIVGSYGYMPLEQFTGQTLPASDLYSLGMTLLYLLTGIHPAELPQANGKVQVEQLCEKVGVSSRFAYWLAQMVGPSLERRFESASVALKALDSNQNGAGSFPHLRPPDSQLFIERDRNKLLIVLPAQCLPSINSLTETLWFVVLFLIVGILVITTFLSISITIFGLLILLIQAISPPVWFVVCGPMFLAFELLFIHFLTDIKHKKISKEKRRSYGVISIDKLFDKQTNHRTVVLRTGHSASASPGQLENTRWYKPISSTHKDQFITFSPPHRFERSYIKAGPIKESGEINLPPKLSIHIGKQTYTLSNAQLTAEDLLWAGKEISDFLDIPLNKIEATDEDTWKKQQSKTKVIPS